MKRNYRLIFLNYSPSVLIFGVIFIVHFFSSLHLLMDKFSLLCCGKEPPQGVVDVVVSTFLYKSMIPQVPHKIVGRRAGDVASCYSDPGLAKAELGWVAERGSIFLAIIAIFSCITDHASHCYFLFSHHLLFHVLRFLNEI